jgi:hypothetical protein
MIPTMHSFPDWKWKFKSSFLRQAVSNVVQFPRVVVRDSGTCGVFRDGDRRAAPSDPFQGLNSEFSPSVIDPVPNRLRFTTLR